MAKDVPKVKFKKGRAILNKAAKRQRRKAGEQAGKFGKGQLGAGILSGFVAGGLGKRSIKTRALAGAVAPILGGLGASNIFTSKVIKRTQKEAESKKGLNIKKVGAIAGLGSLAAFGAGLFVPRAVFKGTVKAGKGLRKVTKKARKARDLKTKGPTRKVKGKVQTKGGKNIKFVRVRGRVIPIRKQIK